MYVGRPCCTENTINTLVYCFLNVKCKSVDVVELRNISHAFYVFFVPCIVYVCIYVYMYVCNVNQQNAIF